MKSIADVIVGNKIIPVVTVERVEDAVPLAESLVSGGLPVVEVTLRTAAALEAIEVIRSSVKNCCVGAGSIVDESSLQAAINAGAEFGVSPGMSNDLLAALETSALPFLPGAGTASEILNLRAAGYFHQKLFPAEIVGGVKFLKGVGGPIGDVTFCPTGGITVESAESYLELTNVFCVGGSWIAPTSLILSGKWDEITQRAKDAAALC